MHDIPDRRAGRASERQFGLCLMNGGDARQLRAALGQFPTGVCIVTCAVGGERFGMTMSSFNALSLRPPLVLFSIDRQAKGLPAWERAEGFAIHVLSENQSALSNRFAGRGADKWSGLDTRVSLHGAPLLAGVAACFECAAHQVHDAGDHRLFIARIEQFSRDADRRPLVFAQGRYATLHRQDEEAPIWPAPVHY